MTDSRPKRRRIIWDTSDDISRLGQAVRSRESSLDRMPINRSRESSSLDHVTMGYQDIDSDVKFLLEVTNGTKWLLWPGESYIHWGYIPSPPALILPGGKGSITGHNEDGHYAGDPNRNLYATGVTGTVSWKIGKTGKKLAIMFSLPFNWAKWKNKLAIAIVDENQTIDKKFCRRMIVEGDLGSATEFCGQIYPIKVKSGEFYVVGTMGTSHHCEIKITFSAKDEEDLAPKLLQMDGWIDEVVLNLPTPVKKDVEDSLESSTSSGMSSQPSTEKEEKEPDLTVISGYKPSVVTPVKEPESDLTVVSKYVPRASSSTPLSTSTAPPMIDATNDLLEATGSI